MTMASNGSQEPKLSGSVETAPQKQKTSSLKRSIYGCFKGASFGTAPIPRSEFVSVGLHPTLKQVGMIAGIYLSVGTAFFSVFQHHLKGKSTNTLIDAIYMSVSTLTTVGYGDLVPDSVVTKLLTSAYAVTGMGLVGLVLSKVSDYFLEKQEEMLVRALHMRQKVGLNETQKEYETHKVKYDNCIVISVVILVLVLTGIIHLAAVEGFDLTDAFYWVSVTITTLGYEDESFKHTKGRFFAIIWISSSTISLAQLFLQVIEVKFEGRQRAFVQRILAQTMTNGDLEAPDSHHYGVVEPSDFIIHKLKQMGKISQEDISLAMEEFDSKLGQSGSLAAPDKMFSEPSKTEKK